MKMKKQTIEAIITGILLVVLVVQIINAVRRTTVRRIPQPLGTVTPFSGKSPGSVTAPPAEERRDLIEQQRAREKIDWKRNPFSRKTGGYTAGDLAVTGIIVDEANPEETCAIINDEVVKKGDSVAGAEIVEIGPESVTIRKTGEVIILPLIR